MKKGSFLVAFLNVLIISAISFGQTYSGPSTGSVDGGAVVTTDNFVLVPIGSELPSEPKIINIEEPDFGPMYYNGDMEVFDNYVYIDDKSANYSAGGEIGINFKLHSFPSIPMTNSIPPDPHMAVGPNHVITTVNSRFHIYDREGNLLKNIDADAWTSAVLPNPSAFDPQIIYDHYEGRWFMLWDNQNSGSNTAFFLISYSDDSNPLGTWYMYALDATKNGSDSTTTWGDYPQIGYDDQAIYINSRQFSFSGSGLLYNKIRILNKSELYASNAGPLTWVDIWNIRRPNGTTAPDVLQPAISYDPGINAAYFTWSSFSTANYYIIYKITDPITNPVLTGVELPVPTYFQAPLANQLGGGSPGIETGGSKIRAATVLRNGKIYAVHGMRNSQFTGYGSLKYFVVDVNTNTVLEQVEQGAQGFFYFYPAIAVDKDHNIAITYSRSADTEYAGSYYSTKLGTDPSGLSPSKVMIEGQGNYVVTFGGSRNRWGDYLGAALDPVNQYNIWLYSEYASNTNQWGTWLTEIRMVPFSGVYGYVDNDDIDFGDVEIGTNSNVIEVQIANYGDTDLNITAIPTAVGDFTLQTSQTIPATLGTYDSLQLEFTYTPTSLGVAEEYFTITSNDPNIPGITVTGNGYQIIPAYSGIFYGSSGISNNGDILSINKTTGQGATIGNSLYNEVKSLTVHPTTNELYGLISGGSATAEIVRVNAEAGDAYTLFTLDLFPLTGIAFNSTGTLYVAMRSGEIYTVDLSNGNYSLVTTSTVAINAIAFHPQTDELWAAYWRAIGATKDEVYKIDLTTGNATLVGETGFNRLTNDLAFDESGVLYGVVGAPNENGQLITIDANDGSGTVVGDIGIQNVVGLGYSINGDPVSVEDDNDSSIPSDYSLAQNYPNPFNPSTSIEFSVPVNSDVTIKIFNLLGEVVTTLVNEEVSAGHYMAVWNGADDNGFQVSSGVYLYEMKANGNNGKAYSQMKKMVFLK